MEYEAIAVCEDCINLIANGELPPDTDPETDQILVDGTIGLMYDGEDLGFDYKPCEACNRKLGGDRYKAFQPVTC